MLTRLWSNWKPHRLLVGISNRAAVVKNNLADPLKVKHRRSHLGWSHTTWEEVGPISSSDSHLQRPVNAGSVRRQGWPKWEVYIAAPCSWHGPTAQSWPLRTLSNDPEDRSCLTFSIFAFQINTKKRATLKEGLIKPMMRVDACFRNKFHKLKSSFRLQLSAYQVLYIKFLVNFEQEI